jgi:hypothetical protein
VRVPQGLAPGCPVRERLASRLFFTLARRALVGWATAVLSLVREHTGRNRSRCRCATEGAEGATPYFPRWQARLDPTQYWRRNIRRAGLHAGVWEVAQDFDASLPDEFWLDRNA